MRRAPPRLAPGAQGPAWRTSHVLGRRRRRQGSLRAFGASAVALVFGLALVGARPALGAEPSAMEQRLIDEALAEKHAELDPEAEGKRIAWIALVRHDVFDPRDPYPQFLNAFHVTTRERVIARELLFAVGQPFRAACAEETARNLRSRRQLSVVLIVPVRTSDPRKVGVLVITKDTWSLRLNYDLQLSGDTLRSLLIQPSEENLFGTHNRASLLFTLQLDTYSVGFGLSSPRLAGTRLSAGGSGNLVFNRHTGALEGSFGSLLYQLPLVSRESKWAWVIGMAWSDVITRRYIGNALRDFVPPSAPSTPMPELFRSDIVSAQYSLKRSFGTTWKVDVSGGVEATRRAFAMTSTEGFSPAAVAEFESAVLPTSDTRVSPFVELDVYSTRFHSAHDLETLALQEDYRLGPTAVLRLYPAWRSLLSTRTLMGVYAGLGVTEVLPPDGLFRATGSSSIQLATTLDESDGSAVAGVRLASPTFGPLRAVLDGRVVNHYLNYLNDQLTLGGDTRPRGYPPDEFQGDDALVASAELRTRGVDILSANAGLAAFYDVGDAFFGFSEFSPAQSVGAGVRVLFPQVNRTVLRVDWGFPVATPGWRAWPGRVYASFGQAFDLPGLVAPSVLALDE